MNYLKICKPLDQNQQKANVAGAVGGRGMWRDEALERTIYFTGTGRTRFQGIKAHWVVRKLKFHV